ncbi:glucose dehydrogenase [Paenibacillus hemerocallicola]|uniref:Glucose dehydrogenase n=1 Tax=Paenibacillus hemerocallicola TaxID=1172614 RepID=A0A5C4TA50_9BACL|nr:alcohol dehydrogenase catalytic domain-containing protein [Paenibacillus hemerocallicola]TNJ65616.1 glucose dehydrogenase [Paenibacillus hemerocallicola]
MKAVVIRNGADRQYVTVAELSKPQPIRPDDVLIRVLAVGLDGTDREIVQDRYGVLPKGSEQMIIGHELLGTVEQAGPESDLSPGELVTVLVRRPCGDATCTACRHGQQDYCQSGTYTERGIRGADGFLCEYVVERSRYVVPIPADSVSYGVLVEPQSIVEKVCSQIAIIQQRVRWEPKTALITGSGPLGVLTALTCRTMGLDTHVWSLSAKDSINARLIRRCGSFYHEAGTAVTGEADADADSDAGAAVQTDRPFASGLDEFAASRGIRPDMIWECSGHTPLAFESMKLLNPNGVLAILGVTSGSRRLDIPIDLLNQEMVLKNKCVIGSVNASRADFENGIRRLQEMERMFPGLLGELMTDRLTMEQVPGLDFSDVAVKAVVDLTGR